MKKVYDKEFETFSITSRILYHNLGSPAKAGCTLRYHWLLILGAFYILILLPVSESFSKTVFSYTFQSISREHKLHMHPI